MSAGLMLRQKIAFGFVTDDQVLTVKRDDLAKSGLVVANVTARAIDPVAPSLSGIVVRLDDGVLPPAAALAVLVAPVLRVGGVERQLQAAPAGEAAVEVPADRVLHQTTRAPITRRSKIP